MRRHSLTLADRLLARTELDDAARVELAYSLTLGRGPTPSEVERGRLYLTEFETGAAESFAAIPEESAGRPDTLVADADAAGTGAGATVAKGAAAKPPIDPDQVIPMDAPVKEEVIRASTPRGAAWASFCQALLGSAEFRYIK